MKVALCSPVSISFYGGAEKRICQIAKLLTQRGNEVEVYALPYTCKDRKIDPQKVLGNIPYYECWKYKIKADVAYIYYQPLVWRLFSLKCPSIAAMRSPGIFQYLASPRFWTFKLLGSFDLASISAIHILSEATRSMVKHNNVFCIPNWIDTDTYRPCKDKDDKFTILYVGRQDRKKGWNHFLKVCNELKKLGYNYNFLCTGQGNRVVKGLGFIDEVGMPHIYSRAHILVNPSLSDTFGSVIVESLSCGTPVVTTPIKPHTALNLPLSYARTTHQFIDKIIALRNMLKTNEYKTLSESCRDEVIRKYHIKVVFPMFENMLRKVVELRK